MNILITGGCGFIGSHLVRLILEKGHEVVNLDKLTYAGNLENLRDCEKNSGYRFVKGDIADQETVFPLVEDAELIINLAAETHVDRSLDSADVFLKTNLFGVYAICNAIKNSGKKIRLLQVSTDEVYGSIEHGAFKETDRFSPTSPYSASKAGAELMAFSFHHAHGLDVVSTRGANTYGPNQFPEKLIPFFATELFEGRKVPLYGDGKNVRDWLHVLDHARAIYEIAMKGESGKAYNIPGLNERQNIDVVRKILKSFGKGEESIQYVKDRAGHDRRYAVDGKRLESIFEFERVSFEKGLAETVAWYKNNEKWWRPLKKESEDFFKRHYSKLSSNER